MKVPAAIALFGLLIGLCAGAGAQTRHDPLNPREADELRESTPEPKKRIDLLVSFARERMLAIERLRDAAQPANQPAPQSSLDDSGRIANFLTDLAAIIDELDDNLEMYNGHNEDLRRPLRHVLDAEAEFLQKLDALSESATSLQKRRFGAALADASDSVKSSSEGASAMLSAQIAKRGEEKNKGKLDRQEAREAQGTQ